MTEDPSEHPHLFSRWRYRAILFTAVIALIVYALFTLWAGWDAVKEALIETGYEGAAGVMGLALIGYFLRFLRWKALLEGVGHAIPFWKNLRIYIAGFALGTTPGRAGEALRSVFLKDYEVSYRSSFGILLSERFSDLLSILLLSALGIWSFPGARSILLILALILFFVFYTVQNDRWLKAIEEFVKKRFPYQAAHLLTFFIETILAFRKGFTLSMLSYGLFLGILAWGVEGIGLYWLLQLTGYPLPLLTVLSLYAFALLVGAISFFPGGLGPTEVVLVQFLTLNEVPSSTAVAVTVVIRLATLWFSVLLGIGAFLSLQGHLRIKERI